MENQHRKIKGYRELNQEEIDLMNEIKKKGIWLNDLYNKLHESISSGVDAPAHLRWLEIGKTHFQQGLMAWTRSVTKPNHF